MCTMRKQKKNYKSSKNTWQKKKLGVLKNNYK